MLHSSPEGGLGFSLEEKWDTRNWMGSEGGDKGWAVHYGMGTRSSNSDFSVESKMKGK